MFLSIATSNTKLTYYFLVPSTQGIVMFRAGKRLVEYNKDFCLVSWHCDLQFPLLVWSRSYIWCLPIDEELDFLKCTYGAFIYSCHYTLYSFNIVFGSLLKSDLSKWNAYVSTETDVYCTTPHNHSSFLVSYDTEYIKNGLDFRMY